REARRAVPRNTAWRRAADEGSLLPDRSRRSCVPLSQGTGGANRVNDASACSRHRQRPGEESLRACDEGATSVGRGLADSRSSGTAPLTEHARAPQAVATDDHQLPPRRTLLILIGDEPHAALSCEVGGRPLDHDDESIAKTDQLEDMQKQPGKPRDRA